MRLCGAVPDSGVCSEADDSVDVGQDCKDVECESDIVEDGQVEDQPHGLGDDQDFFEPDLIPDVDHPCVEARGDDRKPADPAEVVDFGRQQDLDSYDRQLHRDAQRAPEVHDIPQYTDQRRDRAGHPSENDVGNAHQAEHGTLGEKYGSLRLQKADCHHKRGSCQ